MHKNKQPHFLSLLLSISFFIAPAHAQPVAYWPMNETSGTTAADLSGNNYTATIFNSVGEDWAPGKYGNAFVATSDDIIPTTPDVIQNHDYMAISGLNYNAAISATTVCLWVKTNNLRRGTIISFDRSNYWCLGVNFNNVTGNEGKITWSTKAAGIAIHDLVSTVRVDDNQWHHVCAVFDASQANDKKIYLDGTLNTQANAHATGVNIGTGATRYGFIGDSSQAATYNGTRGNLQFKGLIDEMRIYPYALNDQQISALYSTLPGPTNVSGNIATNTTWTVMGSPYIVTGDVTVFSDAKLTIEPGVEVRFNSGTGLQIGATIGTNKGTLDARGTLANPIIFTSNVSNPLPGDWKGIRIRKTGTSAPYLSYIDNVVVEYAGNSFSSAIQEDGESVNITNSKIRKNLWNGISVWHDFPVQVTNNIFSENGNYPVAPGTLTTLRNNQYVNNAFNGILCPSQFYTSGILTKDNAPYLVSNSIDVNSNGQATTPVLTIEPGVTLKFAAGRSLSIGTFATGYPGAINAAGTTQEPIIFTSDSSNPQPGNWRGLRFTPNTSVAQTVLNNLIVEYAGHSNEAAVDINSPITLASSIIRNNQNDGVTVQIGQSPVIQNNSFLNNTGYAISLQQGSTSTVNNATSPLIIGNAYQNNGINGINLTKSATLPTVGIHQPTLLKNDGVPYYVTKDLQILGDGNASPSILTMEPGTQVKFASGTGLLVASSLDARGTLANPIRFTSSLPSSPPGSWNQIRFTVSTVPSRTFLDNIYVGDGGNGNLNAVEIEAPITITNSAFVNNDGSVLIDDTSPTITGSTFLNNIGSPIKIDNPSNSATSVSPVLRNNVYTGNGVQGIEVTTGNFSISKPVTFTKDGVPYILLLNATVMGGAKLTIEPGTQVNFAAGRSLTIGSSSTSKGSLDARGTVNNPITFSSNGTTTPGSWGQIRFNSTGTDVNQTQIDNIIVEYGGSGSLDAFEIEAPIVVTNSTFRNNDGYGIYSDNTTPVLFANNFHSNTLGGVKNTASNITHAENSWWAHASGPSGSGSGTGQAVNPNVAFDPWRGELINPSHTFFDTVILPKTFNQNGGATIFFTKTTESVNWTITIKDSVDATVKTFFGSGTQINQSWLGDNNSSQPLTNGTYKYTISANSIANPGNIITLIGRLTLDDTLPVAKITSPLAYSYVANQIQIAGTATSANFNSYILEYGQGEFPTTWTTITSSSSPITNGVLGTWTLPEISAPINKIRLRVLNNSSGVAVAEVPLKIISFYSVNDTPDPFSPNADTIKDSTTINAGITHSSNWTITIKNNGGTAVKTFSGSGSIISQVWDGKNDGGQLQPDGDYNYQIQATESNSLLSILSAIQPIVLDTSFPTATITTPTSGSSVSLMDVIGSASDFHFSSYLLEYGLGTSPSTWTTIVNSTSPVNNGVLGTFNPLSSPNGSAIIRLTVNDTAGNVSIATVPIQIDNVQITSVSNSPQFINPSLGQNSTLSYTLDRAANVTIELYRMFVTIDGRGDGIFGRQFIGNLLSSDPRPAGVNTLVWNGQFQGQVVDHSAYTYVIRATASGKMGLYDPPYVPGSSSLSNLSVVPSNYNPYANESVSINYTLNVPAWVTIGGQYPTVDFPGFILAGAPRNSGANTEIWDGRDGVREILDDPSFNIAMKTEILPNVFTVVQDLTLKIDQLTAEAYLIIPVYNEVSAINYSITRQADVTIRMIDPNGNSWIIDQVNGQIAGAHSFSWDGTNASGNVVSVEGNYRVEITAEEPSTNTAVVRSANITVHR